MKTTWNYRHSTNDVITSMATTWGQNKRVQVDVTGRHNNGALGGSLVLQTPWAETREIRADMDNTLNNGELVSTSSLQVGHIDRFLQ